MVKVEQARIGARLFNEGITPGDQRIVIRPANHELHRRLEAALTKRWRVQRKAANTRNAGHQRENLGSDGLLLPFTLAPGGQAHKDIGDIANGRALEATHRREDCECLTTIQIALQQVLKADHMFNRIGEGSTFRPRGWDDDHTTVLGGGEFLGQSIEQHHGKKRHGRRCAHDQQRGAERLIQGPAQGLIHRNEEGLCHAHQKPLTLMRT